jgi:hypothetical protein
MCAPSPDDFSREIEKIAESVEAAGAGAYYDPDGDCIEFLAHPEEQFWAERIDDLVTVYYGEETGEVIGSLIKGVSSFIKTHPRFAILVKDGRVRLAHLFLAGFGVETPEETIEVVTYEKKMDVYAQLLYKAEQTNAEAVVA